MPAAMLLATFAQAPPPTHPSWCADAKQYVSVNGTITHSETFHLCLDSTPGSLRWSRKPGASSPIQYFNGTTRFDLTPKGTTGEMACTATYFGPAKPNMMPWAFVLVDPNATFNRTEHGYDGFPDVGVWSVYRPAKIVPVHIQAQLEEPVACSL